MNLSMLQRIAQSAKFKKILVLFAILSLFVVAIGWLANHAYLLVDITSEGRGDVTYVITEQRSRKTTTVVNPQAQFKRLLRRGSYEVKVQRNDATYFSVVHVGGFMTTTKTSGALAQEKERRFVGEQPAGCMHYTGSLLLSYSCGGEFTRLQLHRPATVDNPTSIYTTPVAQEGDIEGIITTAEGTFVVQGSVVIDDEYGTTHTIYPLNNDLSINTGIDLTDLEPSKKYTVRPYDKGFVAYDEDMTQVFYYTSPSAKPTQIKLDKGPSQGTTVYLNDVNPNGIVAAYAKLQIPEKKGPPEKVKSKTVTQIAVNQKGRLSRFTLKQQLDAVVVCGKDRLCTLSEGTASIYDIHGKKPKLLYSIGDVKSIDASTDNLLVVRSNEVLAMDVLKAAGYIDISYGSGYEYCQIQADANGYSLCLTNSKQKNVVLRVDKKKPDVDSINKKIGALLLSPYVNDISIYGNYIFISPEVGPPVYNSVTNGYEAPADVVLKVNDLLRQDISKTGIDTKAYLIYNPYEHDLTPAE